MILKLNYLRIVILRLKKNYLRRRTLFIENDNCLNKNIPGRTNKEYAKAYRDTNKDKIIAYIDTNKEKI